MNGLGEMQDRSYANSGYALLTGFFSTDEISKLSSEVGVALGNQISGKQVTVSDGLIKITPPLQTMLEGAGFLGCGSKDLAYPIFDQAVKRAAGVQVAGPWHQDSMMIPGTNVTLYVLLGESACRPFELIPGSHKNGQLGHAQGEISGDLIATLGNPFRPALEVGTVVVLHPDLVHRGVSCSESFPIVTYSISFK